MRHHLKISPSYYNAVLIGDKNFEIRFNDRGYQKGDTVSLNYYHKGELDVTKEPLLMLVTYVTSFEQKPGWVVFGMIPEDA